MKKQIWIPILVVVVIVAGVLIFSLQKSTVSQEKKVIKIGAILPLSGEASAYGNSWQKGAELAVEEIKKKYGVNIEVVYEDSQFESSKAVTAAQKLINIDNVKAIILGSSRETLAVAPLAEEKKILLMTGGNAAEITNAGDYVFRIYPSNLYQGEDLANFALKQGYTKIAVLTLLDDYGVGLTDIFKKRVEENGGNIISETFPQQGITDFRTQLTKIKNSNSDALLIIAATNQYPLILKQIKELNINIPLLAPETFQSASILSKAGELAEGVLFTTFVEADTKEYDNFADAHQKKYGEMPGPFSSGFYDNIILVSEALIKNNVNIEKAKDWLYNVKNWSGATGITNFDENGDPIGKSYTIMTVKNGQFVSYEK